MRQTRPGYESLYSEAGQYWHVLAQYALDTDWWSLGPLDRMHDGRLRSSVTESGGNG
ncbi:hypothetical protein PSPO01_15579 [Paraphaeosphaeria sporulosa]